jgi:hypothetical protein
MMGWVRWLALPPRGRLRGALVGRRRTLKQPTPRGHEADGPLHPEPRCAFLAFLGVGQDEQTVAAEFARCFE